MTRPLPAVAQALATAGRACRDRIAGPLLVVYLLVVALIVFWPSADAASASVSFLWSLLDRIGLGSPVSPSAVEFVTNVLLFMPLSFLGATFKPQWQARHWLAAGLAGTMVIELTQMLLLPGRSPAAADVLANTLGALAGYSVRRRVEGDEPDESVDQGAKDGKAI